MMMQTMSIVMTLPITAMVVNVIVPICARMRPVVTR